MQALLKISPMFHLIERISSDLTSSSWHVYRIGEVFPAGVSDRALPK
jgi:hypothetical protein